MFIHPAAYYIQPPIGMLASFFGRTFTVRMFVPKHLNLNRYSGKFNEISFKLMSVTEIVKYVLNFWEHLLAKIYTTQSKRGDNFTV